MIIMQKEFEYLYFNLKFKWIIVIKTTYLPKGKKFWMSKHFDFYVK